MPRIVHDLVPGDLVVKESVGSATFIAKGPHPKYPGLQLVIWKLEDGTWSLDALRWNQEVGEAVFSTGLQRWNRILEAFRA